MEQGSLPLSLELGDLVADSTALPAVLRPPGPVGERLASAAFNTVYDGKAAYTGPTIAGCGLAASTLTIAIDAAMLRGDTIVVQNFSEPSFTPYYHGHGNPMFNGGSQLYVQTKAASFCVEPQRTDPTNASSPVYCPTWAGGVGKSVTRPAPIGRFPTFGGAGATTENDPNQFNQGGVSLNPSVLTALGPTARHSG